MLVNVDFEGRHTTFKVDENNLSTFGNLKEYAAPFFSLDPKEFFFCVDLFSPCEYRIG